MVKLTTLGGIDLRSSDDKPFRALLAQPKKVALLAYLAAGSGGTPRERDELRAMFWPEAGDARARHSLNQTLHILRTALGTRAIVSIGRTQLAIESETVSADVETFLRACRLGDLESADGCYGGEFLPGFFIDDLPEFERWLERKRSRLRQLAADAAWKLALVREDSGDLAAAVAYGQRALDRSPYDEGAVQRVVQLLARAGDRASATRLFAAFASSLRTDLEIEPSATTVRLIQSLSEPEREGDSRPSMRVEAVASITAAALRPTAHRDSAGPAEQPRTRPTIDARRRVPAFADVKPRFSMSVFAAVMIAFAVLLTGRDHPAPLTGRAFTQSQAEAYDLYRAGRVEWNKRTPEGLHAALRDFTAAIQRDSLFAPAYSGIADTYTMLTWYGPRPSDDDLAWARAAAARAAALSPELAEAHASLGTVYWLIDHDTARAQAEYSRSIELNGTYAAARDWYAFDLAAHGELREALHQMFQARWIAPTSPTVGTDLATLLFWNRQYDRALDELRRVAALDPSYRPMHQLLWRVHAAMGSHRPAMIALQAVMRDEGRSEQSVTAVQRAYATGDWAAVLTRRFEEVKRPFPNARCRSVEAAVLAAQLGRPDSAALWLLRARQEGNVALQFAWLDPALDRLRDDPRLQTLLKGE